MKKQVISLLLATLMLTTLLSVVAFATEPVASGACGANGDNVSWVLDSNGMLTISGTGDMMDCSSNAPWSSYRRQIKRVVIERGVTSIGMSAFYDCTNLTDIIIPNSVISIGSDTFYGCNNLRDITLPDSVASIGSFAFLFCTSLTSVTIPASVDCIGDRAFAACYGLREIGVAAECTAYSSENGVLFSNDQTTLHTVPAGLEGSYTIPDSVSSINVGAFYGCLQLTDITIPNGVTDIGNWAFFDCLALTDIVLPEGITSISAWTFAECLSLTGITIPNSVTNIGSHAFYNCTELSDVYYSDTKAHWNAILIDSGNDCLTNAAIHLRVDLNGSGGNADIQDMQCLYQYLTSEALPETYQDDSATFVLLADINGDNYVDVYDLQRLYEAVSGVEPF